MFDLLLPKQIDNHFQGRKAALWIFAPVLLLRFIMSFNSMVNSYHIASTADGIPLASYPDAASLTIVSLFSLLGLANLMLCLLGILAFARYRSMIPLLYSFMLLQYVVGRFVHYLHPIPTNSQTAGIYVNLGLHILILIGLALSLSARKQNAPAIAAGAP